MALTIDEPVVELESAEARPAPGVQMAGDRAERYIARLIRAIRAGRLNALFPPARRLCTHLSYLQPSRCEQLYPAVHLAPQSGMPTARDVFRVKIDRDLAGDFLLDTAKRPTPAPGTRLARRIAYYSRLQSDEIMPLSRIRVELRQQVPDKNLAQFRVTFDRFDIGTCQFARYTILLDQQDRFWRKQHVIVDDADLAAPTESFRRIVRRFTADEAELALVLLSTVDGIAVEDIRRTRVGPFFLPGARVGDRLEQLLDYERTPEHGADPRWILCLPEDRAGIDVAAHASGDPLASLYRDALGPDARQLIDAKADELDYRVSKTRKFVCSANLSAPLAQLCRQLGAPSIVRGIQS